MRKHFKLNNFCALLLTSFVTFMFTAAGATAQDKADGKKTKEAAKVAQNASSAFDAIMSSGSPIPRDVLAKAKAVGVFPDVVKAAFIVGGRGGKGLISRRTAGGWSAPAYFRFGGGSVGFQIGASKTDVILLFMTEDSLRKTLESKFEIGGEAAAAAGPVGRTAGAATDAQLQAGILSYSRSKGLFAGVSISGAVITADDDLNQSLYQTNSRGVLGDGNKPVATVGSATSGVFPRTLAKY